MFFKVMEKSLIFYDIMGYNYPENKEYFFINKDLSSNIIHSVKNKKKLSSNTKTYENIIDKYHFLYKNIPFVDSIYVCNSLSFKSVHENSDIDLFIVCKDDRIFLAKLFVWIFFKLFGIYGTHEKNKFCCGFYVTKQQQDLYPISIYPFDLYLAYWIAHLQVVYMEKEKNKNIFTENIWIKEIIPSYNQKEQKILNIQTSYGKGKVKKILEKIFGWDFLNKILGIIWKKRMMKGKEKLGRKGKNIIISDNILKFQAPDIRKNVYLKFKTLQQNNIKDHKEIDEQSIFE